MQNQNHKKWEDYHEFWGGKELGRRMYDIYWKRQEHNKKSLTWNKCYEDWNRMIKCNLAAMDWCFQGTCGLHLQVCHYLCNLFILLCLSVPVSFSRCHIFFFLTPYHSKIHDNLPIFCHFGFSFSMKLRSIIHKLKKSLLYSIHVYVHCTYWRQ
jgi:hypothetical protein